MKTGEEGDTSTPAPDAGKTATDADAGKTTPDAGAKPDDSGSDTILGAAAKKSDTSTDASDKKDDTKDTSTADDKKEEPKAVDIKVTLPNDSTIGQEDADAIAATARDKGWSQDVAQAAVELLNSVVEKRETAYNESIKPGGAKWKENTTTWRAAALKDPDIGGTTEKLNESGVEAVSAIKTFFGEDAKHLLDFLDESGMASHPMIIKGFAKIARRMKEGSIRKEPAPPEPEKVSTANKLYGNTSTPGKKE